MRKVVPILFSKALILTYLFIGYLAIVDDGAPYCVVNTIPVLSNNNLAFPSPVSLQITTAKHLSSPKQSVRTHIAIVHVYENPSRQFSLRRKEHLLFVLFSDAQPCPSNLLRGPPSI